MSAMSACGFGVGPLEGHRAFLHVGLHGECVARKDIAVEELHGQRALDEALEGALERSRAKLQAKGPLSGQSVSPSPVAESC